MKPRILFVDDDENLLNALQRMLRGQRGSWDMTFATGGAQALEMMKTDKFDVVVSDMRMPEMDGATLLSEVERLYPATVRVILSGYADEQSIFRSVGPAHQYVAKPCDPEDIASLMERSLKLREVLVEPSLRSLVAGLRNLPSPPDLYLRITEEMRREQASASSVAKIIADDVAMTAELLRITNSSYFAFHSQITNVVQAVRLLGMDTVRTLVLAVGIFKDSHLPSDSGATVARLSAHGLMTGRLARRIAEADGAEEPRLGQAFCAGMLNAVGHLILMGLPAGTKEVKASPEQLGAYLLGLWGFPDPVVEAVLYQSHPSDCVFRQKSVLSYLHLARVHGPVLPVPGNGEGGTVAPDEDYLKLVGIDEAALGVANLASDHGNDC